MPHGRHTETITLLGLLTALTPLSVDMYLPALPALGLAFSAEPGHVQLSLASFFLGLAIGQAFYGPISDRFGRRLPLYTGLFLFVLASAGCALARSIDLLIALRFFQALGACSSQVIARAVVRGLFEAHEAVRVFSLLVLVMGVGPVLAPLLGGQILTWLGWRAIFWLHTILGSIGLAAAILRLPETHRARPTAPLKLRSVLRGYYQLLADRYFIGYALTGGLGMAGMFAYIVGSPFVFIELFHVRPDRFGFFFGANALGLIAASQVNIRLTRRFKGDLVIGKALTIQTVACLLLIATTIGRTPGLYSTAAFLFVYVALLGCLYPNTTALAMEPYREKAGSASALLGTLQFTLAATAATVVGATNNGTAMPMVLVLGTSGIAAFLLYGLLVRKEPRNAAAVAHPR